MMPTVGCRIPGFPREEVLFQRANVLGAQNDATDGTAR
jgi:hypothetical protein